MTDEANGNGNGSAGGPTLLHPWQLGQRLAQEAEPPTVMEADHLDCQGRRRTFRIEEYVAPIGGCLEAQELRDGEPTGWRLPLYFDPATEVPPYYELRRRLSERLATRNLIRDPETGRLEVMNMVIRAQVGGAEEIGEGPELLIDGDVVTWEELGSVLAPYAGWGLRIVITETGEE